MGSLLPAAVVGGTQASARALTLLVLPRRREGILLEAASAPASGVHPALLRHATWITSLSAARPQGIQVTESASASVPPAFWPCRVLPPWLHFLCPLPSAQPPWPPGASQIVPGMCSLGTLTLGAPVPPQEPALILNDGFQVPPA